MERGGKGGSWLFGDAETMHEEIPERAEEVSLSSKEDKMDVVVEVMISRRGSKRDVLGVCGVSRALQLDKEDRGRGLSGSASKRRGTCDSVQWCDQ